LPSGSARFFMASSFTSFLFTNNDAPQSVGLLWIRDQLVAETSTWHTTHTTNIHMIKKHPVPTKRATIVSNKVKSWNALLCILLVCVRSYLKSVLRYTILILNTSHPDTLHLLEQQCEDLWLFSKTTAWETLCTIERDIELHDPHCIGDYSRCLTTYCYNSESRPELYSIYFKHNGYRVFPGDKEAGAWCWPPTPSSAKVKKG
jgi:hypothetical protein